MKAKIAHTNKALLYMFQIKELSHHFPRASRVQPSQGKQDPTTLKVTWEDKCQHYKCFLLLLPRLYAKHDGLEYHFGQLGTLVLAVFPLRKGLASV